MEESGGKALRPAIYLRLKSLNQMPRVWIWTLVKCESGAADRATVTEHILSHCANPRSDAHDDGNGCAQRESNPCALMTSLQMGKKKIPPQVIKLKAYIFKLVS
jgi:hypothetical protein